MTDVIIIGLVKLISITAVYITADLIQHIDLIKVTRIGTLDFTSFGNRVIMIVNTK